MIRNNVKISLDSDTATQVALDTNFTYSIGFNLPTPKLSSLSVQGSNGAIDLSDALGGIFYNNRTVKMALQLKNGAVNAATACERFIATYSGQTVRLYFGNTYYIVGRMTVAGDNMSDELRQLSCEIDAYPFKLAQAYTTASITLSAPPANQWGTRALAVESEIVLSSSGFTYPPGESGEIDLYVTAGNPYRFYVFSKSNCKLELVQRVNGHDVPIGASVIVPSADKLTLIVKPTSAVNDATGTIYFAELPYTTISNSGEVVPLEISNTVVMRSSYSGNLDIWVSLNGSPLAVPDQTETAQYREYPQINLKKGTNKLVVYVPDTSFNPSTHIFEGEISVRFRKGEL